MSSRISKLNDVAWLREKYEVERLSTCQIAEKLKCNSTTVNNALRRCEIHIRHCSEAHGYAELNDVKWLRQKYEVEMLSTYEIGDILGCASSSVYSALRRGKVATRSVSEGNMAKNPSRSAMLKDVKWLQEKYEVEMLSTKEIGNILRCTYTTVLTALHRGGVRVRGISEVKMINNLRGFALLHDVKWLRLKYEVEMLSTLQIADIVGCFPTVVNSALRRNGIYVRSSIESQKRGELHPRYGTHLSEQTKQKLRIARMSQRFPSHHTKPELQFEAICRNNNLPFEFTGDGKVWIGKRGKPSINPDFIYNVNKKRFAVFVNGDFWHSQLLRPQLRDTQSPLFQIKQSKKHRWVPIILWETDLKREDAEAFVLSTLKKEGFDMSSIEQQQNAEQILPT